MRVRGSSWELGALGEPSLDLDDAKDRVAPCGVTSSERTGGMVRFGQVLWHRSGRGAGGGAAA